jgi:hypothetical protein
MPAILEECDCPKWLGEAPATEDELKALFKPCRPELIKMWLVGKAVGKSATTAPNSLRQRRLRSEDHCRNLCADPCDETASLCRAGGLNDSGGPEELHRRDGKNSKRSISVRRMPRDG